jgi:hypothetical protein
MYNWILVNFIHFYNLPISSLLSVVFSKTFFHSLTKIMMIDFLILFIEINNSTDNTFNAFTLQFFFIRVEVFLQSWEIDIKHDCAMMEGFFGEIFFCTEMQSVGWARKLYQIYHILFYHRLLDHYAPTLEHWHPAWLMHPK